MTITWASHELHMNFTWPLCESRKFFVHEAVYSHILCIAILHHAFIITSHIQIIRTNTINITSCSRVIRTNVMNIPFQLDCLYSVVLYYWLSPIVYIAKVKLNYTTKLHHITYSDNWNECNRYYITHSDSCNCVIWPSTWLQNVILAFSYVINLAYLVAVYSHIWQLTQSYQNQKPPGYCGRSWKGCSFSMRLASFTSTSL